MPADFDGRSDYLDAVPGCEMKSCDGFDCSGVSFVRKRDGTHVTSQWPSR
jgi:hypothetical protein